MGYREKIRGVIGIIMQGTIRDAVKVRTTVGVEIRGRGSGETRWIDIRLSEEIGCDSRTS